MAVQTYVVLDATEKPYLRTHRSVETGPLAVVHLADGWVQLNSSDPMVFLRLAKECEKAANWLADEALEAADLEARGA